MIEIKDEFATPRRTVIVDQEGEMEDEDLIQREDMLVIVSHAAYVRRVPLATYRAQKRGGKGRAGMQTREEDFVARLFVANTHTPVLFFSSRGQVYKEKVWRLPLAAPQARGKALINILPLAQDERITTIMPLPEDESSWANLDVMFATTRGTVRRNKLSDFVEVRRSGMLAMRLDEGEAIVDVQICTDKDDVVLTVSERGYGKRTSSYEYRTTGRGGKGIVAMDNRECDGTLRAKIGRLVASFPVEESDQLMLVTDGGQLIRCGVAEISIKGRKTRGVIVFNTADGERVVAVERLSEEEGNGNGE